MARACPGPPSEFSTCFSTAPAAYHSPEVLAVAPGVDSSLARSEHSPCLVGDIITLDDASFTTEIAVHRGANALAPFGYVPLLDTGSLQTFTGRGALDITLSVGGASPACERKCASHLGVIFTTSLLYKLGRASA